MDVIKYKRGSVWFINDNFVGVGHIQSKSRPYVVVSNDKCNSYSPVIHMAPITSKVKSDYRQDVIYAEAGGNTSVILCGQITPKDVATIDRCSRYMYTLSDETMTKVDEAIRFQFFYKEDEEDIANEVNNELVSELSTEEVAATVEVPAGPVELDIPRTAAGRIKWTPELKAQFLKDATKYLEDEMMIRYRLTKLSYLNTFYRFRKESKNNE